MLLQWARRRPGGPRRGATWSLVTIAVTGFILDGYRETPWLSCWLLDPYVVLCTLLLIPDFGVKQVLPGLTETVVEFTPDKVGSFPFTCGMKMIKGTLVVN